MWIYRILVFGFCLGLATEASAKDFSIHRKNIGEIESQMKILDKELEDKIASKKATRDQARIEEILQRIVEIHGELISLRKDLDNELQQVRADHYEDGKAINLFSDVKQRLSVGRRKKPTSPLQVKMNALFRKVQSKYASFVAENAGTQELERVETVVETQEGARKSKEAEVYLRKKSEVKLKK